MPRISWTWLIVGLIVGYVASNYMKGRARAAA